MHRTLAALLSGTVLLAAPVASAHISITSGPATADQSQVVTFGVGHGCEGTDSYTIKVDIPAGVTSVRPEPSTFGKATLEKSGAGVVTAVIWQKAEADLLPEDTQYYRLNVRFKAPNAPFTTIAFPIHQTCKVPGGATTTVEWTSTTEGVGEPAATLRVLPARKAGWNKITVPVAILDLSLYFADAEIVWKGNAAYSVNPETVAQISGTEGTRALSSLAAGDEVWVKY
jgi:uncharacterized protein YcnI